MSRSAAKSSQSLARSTPSFRAALVRTSPATTPLAERRRPRLACLLRLDVYVVPPLPLYIVCFALNDSAQTPRTESRQPAPRRLPPLRLPVYTPGDISMRRVATSSWDGIAAHAYL
ncbi:hypothetical protein B0H14DRAFT_3485569 [Mycena olivaceomarginata]|nr:hypothetical protein B0H14DRAFT_3485569 [Mycena olivaceomarginata]